MGILSVNLPVVDCDAERCQFRLNLMVRNAVNNLKTRYEPRWLDYLSKHGCHCSVTLNFQALTNSENEYLEKKYGFVFNGSNKNIHTTIEPSDIKTNILTYLKKELPSFISQNLSKGRWADPLYSIYRLNNIYITFEKNHNRDEWEF